MSKFCQLVIGPAGCGKSTYCETVQTYASTVSRRVDVINLDPANDYFPYQHSADVRELISVEDVMEDDELGLGPNGALVFCMEYLVKHLEWLREMLEDGSDDYVLFDCPGQTELYTHGGVMTSLMDELVRMGFGVVVVFVLDSHFLTDPFKFIGGVMCALASIVNIEASCMCVLSKVDLLDTATKDNLEDLLDPSSFRHSLDDTPDNPATTRLKKVALAIADVIDNYGLVRFLPLDITDHTCIQDLFSHTDTLLQYADYADVKTNKMDDYVDTLGQDT